MTRARLTPMPAAELDQWRQARREAASSLPEPGDGGDQAALTIVVDEVAVGGVFLTRAEDGGRRRCTLRTIETTLPAEATEAWSAVLVALDEHARSVGADTLVTAVAPPLAPVFQASGYQATVTTHARGLEVEALFQEDTRVSVRTMTDDERHRFAVEVRETLRTGMLRAGLLLGPDASLGDVEAQVERLDAEAAPPGEMLMTGTVDGHPVGRAWATLVEQRGGLDFYGNVIDLFPEHRGAGLTRSFLGALARYCETLGVRDIHLRIYGHDTGARRTFLTAGVAMADVHLRKDLA